MLRFIYNNIEKSLPDAENTLKVSITSTIMFFITHTLIALFFLSVYIYLRIPEMVFMSYINVFLYCTVLYITFFKRKLTMATYILIFALNYYILWSTYFGGYDKNAVIVLPVLIFTVNIMFPINRVHKNLLTFFMLLTYIILYYIKRNVMPMYYNELYFLHDVNIFLALSGTLFVIYTDKILNNYIKVNSDRKLNTLTKKVNTDYLTGLVNRRFLEEKFNEKGFLKNSYIVIADIDFFKNVNDTYGHNAGDTVLKKLATMYNSHFRDTDIICRWGGEEFIFIIKRINESSIDYKLESLRSKIEKHTFKHKNDKIKITVSFGVCTVDSDIDVDKNIEYADEALYHAKENGRNKIVFYERL